MRQLSLFGPGTPDKQTMTVARRAWSSALRSGRVERPDICEVCGIVARVHGHHEDYTKPLEVRWLCPKCHKAEHHQLRAGCGCAGCHLERYGHTSTAYKIDIAKLQALDPSVFDAGIQAVYKAVDAGLASQATEE